MGKKYQQLQTHHLDFIAKQYIFFVATTTKNSFINLSPKDTQSLSIINERQLLWLNLTGSGNQTAACLQEDNRMTMMFCALEGNPNIVRIYGKANIIYPSDDRWQAMLSSFDYTKGARQIIELNIDLVVNSCGFGVPLYEFVGHRKQLQTWTTKKGKQGIKTYQQEKNTISLGGEKIKS